MPIKSSKQYKFMRAASNKKGIGGIEPSVAKEFLRKTSDKKKSLFGRGKD
jgi:hypothetical protein